MGQHAIFCPNEEEKNKILDNRSFRLDVYNVLIINRCEVLKEHLLIDGI